MKKVLVAVCALSLVGATTVMAKTAEEIFKGTCQTCHGPKGEGKKALGPALKGSEFVTKGADADVKATIKDGRTGATKKYKDFAGPMPAQKSLTDNEIHELVEYLKKDLQK